jgi:hypothetical protein
MALAPQFPFWSGMACRPETKILVQKFMAKVVGGFAKLIGYKGYIPFPSN